MSLAHHHFKAHKELHVDLVDGMRAIAILLIVWYHLWQQSWLGNQINFFGINLNLDFLAANGFFGVELLLFISGFGLFLPYAKHLLEGEKLESNKQFFLKRAARILPSYYLNIFLVLLVLSFLINHPLENTKSLLTHLFFLHNLFPETFFSLNGVLWTLGVEVQFYLLFPLIAQYFMKNPYLGTFLMTLVALIYRFLIEQIFPTQLPFFVNQLPAFFDLYGFGMLFAYLLVYFKKKKVQQTFWPMISTLLSLVFWFLLLIIFASIYQRRLDLNQIALWQNHYRLILAGLFLAISLSSTFSFKIWQKIIANPLFMAISMISYNLFLWHQIIFITLKELKIPSYIGPDPHLDPHWQLSYSLLGLGLSILVATVFTYGFERPLLAKILRLKP